jgi:2-polyprenyl-3-methyl-5-hydroxy-6-metoxy-1,4-benzoquinol methylase
MIKREKKRDDREYDTTQLHEAGHGRTLHRDYSAHFFRWSFARRFISRFDNVLEIGCGEDKPLSKILTGGAAAHVNTYVGVDINKLKPSNSQRLRFLGEFNFVENWQCINDFVETPAGGYDVIVHYEVIEHMKVEHGLNMLKGCYALLKPGGAMLMSTPCYDGVRHAANHIHEYTIPELQDMVEVAGFKIEQRFGTFIDIKHIKKSSVAIANVAEKLAQYYDNDAISCIFAPLFPDQARNNLWVCRKPSGAA